MQTGLNATSKRTFTRFGPRVAWAWAMASNRQAASLLGYWPVAKRMLVVTTIADLARVIAKGPQTAWVGYNIEGWAATPASEQADPAAACQAGHAIATVAGRQFAVLPSYPVSVKSGAAMLPHCELYCCQGKGLQALGDAAKYRAHLAALKAMLPSTVSLWGDLGAAPKGEPVTARAMYDWVMGFDELVSGASVLAQEAQYAAVTEYLRLLGS